VMGPSGSGKSTLLHLLGGLDAATSGEVLLEGNPLSKLSDKEITLARRYKIGFVFQFFNLVPVLTVEENVSLPAVLDRASDGDAQQRAKALLTDLGLDNALGKLPSQLSGGEQQRVAVARALINEPKIVLADEPTGNLDRRSGAEVMSVLGKLHEGGQTVALVTHDPAIASFARRVVFMQDGKLIDSMSVGVAGDATPILERLAAIGQ
jgi:putative ABC transport system ATP-binding protein